MRIYSIRNEFDNFSSIIEKHVDVLVIAETKLDWTSDSHLFHIPGIIQPYRLDVSSNS